MSTDALKPRSNGGGGIAGAHEAVIVDAATSVSDEVRVLIPGFDGGQNAWGPCPWEPRVDGAGGSVYPAAGDRALVLLAATGEPWIAAWTPSGAGFSPSGGAANALDFGAARDGVTDDTLALQAALDAVIPSTDPATTTRFATRALYIPAGTYRITAPLKLRSVMGYRLLTDGTATRIHAGKDMDAILDLNGVGHSIFDGFTLTSDGDVTVGHALKLWWDNTPGSSTKAARSTLKNHFAYIDVRNCRYVTGVQFGNDGANNQVDSCSVGVMSVVGTWTEGEATLWQNGFKVGSGVHANNLLHHVSHLTSQRNKRNLHMAASQLSVDNAQFQHAEVDIHTAGHKSYLHVKGVRSEGSTRFLATSGGTTVGAFASFEDITFHLNALAADGFWVNWPLPGTLRLVNINLQGVPPVGVVPKIKADPTRALNLIVEGFGPHQTLDTAFSLGVNVRLSMTGYSALSGAAVVTADSYGGFLTTDRLWMGARNALPTVSVSEGAGTPEGVVTAGVGSLHLRRDGGAGTSMYVKESGTGNTGWATPGGGGGGNDDVTLAPATSARNTITPSATDAVNLTARALAGQTALLQQWQDSAGATVASMSATGLLQILPNSLAASLMRFSGGQARVGWNGSAAYLQTNGGSQSIVFITAGATKAEVLNAGDIRLPLTGAGVIVKSPDGLTSRRIGIDNSGAIVATAV